jgi:hypothetical protein
MVVAALFDHAPMSGTGITEQQSLNICQNKKCLKDQWSTFKYSSGELRRVNPWHFDESNS